MTNFRYYRGPDTAGYDIVDIKAEFARTPDAVLENALAYWAEVVIRDGESNEVACELYELYRLAIKSREG